MTKAQTSKEILKILSNLTAKASSGEIKYEEFKQFSEKLKRLYKTLYPETSFKGFSLCSDTPLIWMNPEEYRAANSYTNKWVTKATGKRIGADTGDEELCKTIYTILLKIHGVKDYSSISLLGNKHPELRKLGGKLASATYGEITYLELAKETTLTRTVRVPVVQNLTLEDDFVAITGERDVSSLELGIPHILAGVYHSFQTVCAPAPLKLPNLEGIELNVVAQDPPAKLLVKKLNYRDKKGALHEFDYSSKPIPLGKALQKVSGL